MKSIIFLLMALAITNCHNPLQIQPLLIPTLVTAWYPNPQKSELLPTGVQLAQFIKILEMPANIIVFGNQNLADLVNSKQKNSVKKFLFLDQKDLTKDWYYKIVEELQKSGQQTKAIDSVSPILTYSRMFLLKKAVQQDTFKTDEFIWVDFKSFSSFAVQKILETKNLNSLILAFKHHFFFLTQPKSNVHVYPNVEKTYFQANFTTFVGGTVFGGKRQAIATIAEIYSDLLRVIIEFDKNLWSEDAVLSLLADRCPYLISYLSADDIKQPTTNRLLPAQNQIETDKEFQQQKTKLQYYQWIIGICQIGIVIIGLLLAWQILKFLKFTKKNTHHSPRQDTQMLTNSDIKIERE